MGRHASGVDETAEQFLETVRDAVKAVERIEEVARHLARMAEEDEGMPFVFKNAIITAAHGFREMQLAFPDCDGSEGVEIVREAQDLRELVRRLQPWEPASLVAIPASASVPRSR